MSSFHSGRGWWAVAGPGPPSHSAAAWACGFRCLSCGPAPRPRGVPQVCSCSSQSQVESLRTAQPAGPKSTFRPLYQLLGPPGGWSVWASASSLPGSQVMMLPVLRGAVEDSFPWGHSCWLVVPVHGGFHSPSSQRGHLAPPECVSCHDHTCNHPGLKEP